MKTVQEIANKLNVVPKLRLGVRLEKGGAESTGPHKVKFIEEPTEVPGMDDKGNPRRELRFIVEEDGQKYRWQFPLRDKKGEPNYLIERTMYIEVGDERILEMRRQGARNYIDVRMVHEEPEPPEDVEEESDNQQ